MSNYFKNERGGMLVYTLLVFLIFTVLGVSLMAYTFSDVKLSKVDHKQQGAFYIAEAGANKAFHDIKEDIYLRYEAAPNKEVFFSTLEAYLHSDWNDEIINDFEEQLGENPIAMIEVERTSTESDTFQIKSKGIIGEQERVVSKEFTINYKEGSSSAINLPEGVAGIFRDNASLNGSASVDGDMYIISESTTANDLYRYVNGTVFVPDNVVDSRSAPLPDGYDLLWYNQLASIINQFPTSFPQDAEDYDLPSNRTITIDTKGNTINIVVDEISTNRHINIIGSGQVNLYVRNKIDLKGQAKVNQYGDTSQLTIYYAGNSEIKINGGQRLNGSIFTKTANVSLTGSSNFNGFIISGGNEVSLNGGNYSEALIIAPYADLKLRGGSEVNGIIIGKTLDGGGNPEIKYKKFDTSRLPFSPIEADSGGEIIETGPTIEID